MELDTLSIQPIQVEARADEHGNITIVKVGLKYSNLSFFQQSP